MSGGKKGNLPASVLARLLARSKQSGVDNQLTLTAYGYERFLARLAESTVRERFVLKGAMLLQTWSEHPYRSTRDLDLLRRGDASDESIRRDIDTICRAVVEPDGVEFDVSSLRLEPIRIEDEYGGTRATIDAYCGKVRLPLQIDIGVGDALVGENFLRVGATSR
ncbi:MAG TPA: nucleotidyl transferase AbiEii/AbiGii toxin family protein [Thermoanaerobaculia bacterium]|nr:nucleotidyl transferase AbiEii/AbiGii toxin family protein [Thermoanaerobaculia bacterium]